MYTCPSSPSRLNDTTVTETNLSRESNAQLRDENKRNFEECQELRDRLQNFQLEIEQLRKSVREKDIELDVAQKELEMQKAKSLSQLMWSTTSISRLSCNYFR